MGNPGLAFNDPPADYDVADPYIVVNLDEACRCLPEEVPTVRTALTVATVLTLIPNP